MSEKKISRVTYLFRRVKELSSYFHQDQRAARFNDLFLFERYPETHEDLLTEWGSLWALVT